MNDPGVDPITVTLAELKLSFSPASGAAPVTAVFDRLQSAGIGSMKVALRAATHLDWVPMAAAASRHGEAVSIYYTLAWFDRYLKGPQDAALAADAYRRLTAETFDDSADRHNISQGLFDPVAAATAADPYAGNVPYALAGTPVTGRLSFYFHSKCDIAVPSSGARAITDDMRLEGCATDSARRARLTGGGSLGWEDGAGVRAGCVAPTALPVRPSTQSLFFAGRAVIATHPVQNPPQPPASGLCTPRPGGLIRLSCRADSWRATKCSSIPAGDGFYPAAFR